MRQKPPQIQLLRLSSFCFETPTVASLVGLLCWIQLLSGRRGNAFLASEGKAAGDVLISKVSLWHHSLYPHARTLGQSQASTLVLVHPNLKRPAGSMELD